MIDLRAPSWLLLFWCGFAASLASEWIVAAVRALFAGRSDEKHSGPRLMSAPRGSVPIAVVTGTLVSAPVYGLIFEWIHRADLTAGVVLGALHGLLAGVFILIAFIRRRRMDRRDTSVRPLAVFRVRRLLTRVLYGALLGFLYVVPPT